MSNKKNWNGVLFIDEIILHRNNKILYKENNIKNIFHSSGQAFFLKILFNNRKNPNKYYLGLDNRTSITLNDTLESLEGEPTAFGYSRQGVLTEDFKISVGNNGNYKASGPTITFSASTGSWGPVKNIFLTNVSSGVSGYLISTAKLLEEITVSPSDSITLKFAFTFSN